MFKIHCQGISIKTQKLKKKKEPSRTLGFDSKTTEMKWKHKKNAQQQVLTGKRKNEFDDKSLEIIHSEEKGEKDKVKETEESFRIPSTKPAYLTVEESLQTERKWYEMLILTRVRCRWLLFAFPI